MRARSLSSLRLITELIAERGGKHFARRGISICRSSKRRERRKEKETKEKQREGDEKAPCARRERRPRQRVRLRGLEARDYHD